MIRKEMIAMLLAGGQGSRLGVLTSKVAKPAVAFGGKYRIIDFPLSNCINSGVDTVGVLTQYQPLRLNTHIGIGIPWDLDRNIGGVTILPPYEKSSNSEWYTGTANAIYQNIDYMESFNPEYVLILSGDHIYKMDYEVMLDFHKEKGSEVTIAVMPVPYEEAKRFGIVIADEDRKIVDALLTARVKGRNELMDVPAPFAVIIDYAHNGTSFNSVIDTVKEFPHGRIITVFGSVGDRAQLRRQEMGLVSGKKADLSVITSDDPGMEDPVAIAQEIASFVKQAGGEYVIIPDRTEAVHFALSQAKAGDIVLLLGKGHETVQKIKGEKVHYSDHESVESFFNKICDNETHIINLFF